MRSLADRFWAKVDRRGMDDCWLWTAARTKTGYGAIATAPNTVARAHRVSWELAHGPIPAGMVVCHRCDTRLCVNPAHLFLGTQFENIHDMHRKGRGHIPEALRGSANARAKLSEAQVATIKRRLLVGDFPNQDHLAAEYGVSQTLISDIARGRCWSHVEAS